MAEEIVLMMSPNGTPVRCVKSQLYKDLGNDLWGRPLTVEQKANFGVK